MRTSQLTRIEQKIDELMWLVFNLLKGETKMSASLDRLTNEVRKNKDVTDSAVALIQGLAQQIRDAADDPEALEALAASLESQDTKLADAVTANTPSA